MKLFFIVSLGFILRLVGAFMAPDHFVFSDSVSYNKIANSILQGNGFTELGSLQSVRPPVYPLILSFFYLCGFDLFGTRVIQVVVGCCSIWLLHLLAKRISKNEKVALVSSFLFAIDPLQITFCSLVLTETFFCFLFLLCLLLLHKCYETGCKQDAIILGCIFAVGSLLRSVLFPFVFFIAFFWGISRKEWKLPLLTIFTMFIVMSPWIMRNFFIHKAFIPTTTKTGVNLYEGLGPGATGGPRMHDLKLPNEYHKLNEIEKDFFLRKETLKYLSDNPGQFFRLCGTKIFRLWNPGLNDVKLKRRYIIHYALIIFTVLLYMCSLYGLFCISWQNTFYLLLPIIYVSFVHMVFIGSIRYRIPVLPCLDIMASFAIVSILKMKDGVNS